jgi:glycyl-tRNA synthetase alpha subunit
MGVLTGVPLGVAQALALPPTTRCRRLWAVTTPALWGLGWTVTTLAGIDVGTQYTIFGVAGTVTFSALSGLVLHGLLMRKRS